MENEPSEIMSDTATGSTGTHDSMREDPLSPDTLVEPAAAEVALELSAFRKVLRNKSFMSLWLSQCIASMGDWVIVGVLLSSVNEMAGETGLAIMMAFRFLPAFLFGLPAGAIVDRMDRKTVMIVCDLARCALVALLAFAKTLWAICILVFLIEMFSLLFTPSKDSAIPDLVEKDEVMTANSLMSTSTYLTMALGTMIATVILGLGELVWKFPLISNNIAKENFVHEFAFIVDAISFAISAALLLFMTLPRRFEGKMPKLEGAQIWRDFKEGLRFMWRNPLTKVILGVMIIGLIGGGSLYVLGAPFAQQVLGATDAKFTLIIAFLMVGIMAGAALAPVITKHIRLERWFGRSAVGFGLVMVAFSLSDVYVMILLLILFGGGILGFLLVTAFTLMHQNIDESMHGRVFAAFWTILRTCFLISMGLFAGVAALFKLWIPWTPEAPVAKVIDLGITSHSMYPAALSIMVGGFIVIMGGIIAMRVPYEVFTLGGTWPGGEYVEAPAETMVQEAPSCQAEAGGETDEKPGGGGLQENDEGDHD